HDIAHHVRRVQCKVACVDAAEAPADHCHLAAGAGVNLCKPLAQRGAYAYSTAEVSAHLPGMGVVSELRQITAHRHHRQIAGEKARQGQHRVAIAFRRAQQQRRHHQAGIEFEYAPHLGQKQAETRRAKLASRRSVASVGRRRHFLSGERVPPRPVLRPVIAANMSLNRSANFGSNESQLCINASGETFWILSIIWCWSFSITAVCIGCTSGSPKNCRASCGVQSISTLTFMCAPWLSWSYQPISPRPRAGSKPSKGRSWIWWIWHRWNVRIGPLEALDRIGARVGK